MSTMLQNNLFWHKIFSIQNISCNEWRVTVFMKRTALFLWFYINDNNQRHFSEQSNIELWFSFTIFVLFDSLCTGDISYKWRKWIKYKNLRVTRISFNFAEKVKEIWNIFHRLCLWKESPIYILSFLLFKGYQNHMSDLFRGL